MDCGSSTGQKQILTVQLGLVWIRHHDIACMNLSTLNSDMVNIGECDHVPFSDLGVAIEIEARNERLTRAVLAVRGDR